MWRERRKGRRGGRERGVKEVQEGGKTKRRRWVRSLR